MEIICRRARKQQADKKWRSSNSDYDATRAAKKRAWAQGYPNYWQQYRASHPAYAERNRHQSLERVRASRRMFANQDAIRRDPVGYLEGLRQGPLFANQDAMARSIDGVVLYLLQRDPFANPNTIASSPTVNR